ncbi:MAG TPA: PAS domain-containing protein [Steroidobacteraceae bacterium]|jgi:PAS domain S-box-containing protein|nr:PAS domain-containing protein [Steroidobacteraceae bacterium]
MSATPELQLDHDVPTTLDDAFRLLAEQWAGAVLLFGADGRLRWFNDAGADWLPLRGRSSLGRDGAAVFARWQLEDAWRESLSGSCRLRHERTPLFDAESRPRWAQLRLQTLVHGETVAAVVCVIEALDANQPSQLATPLDPDSALSANQVGLWSWNFATGEGYIAAGWCNSLQLDPCAGADYHARWSRQMHPDDLTLYRRRVEDFKAGATGYLEVEYRILTTDNRWLWILQRGDVVESTATGAALRAAGICIEIDERKREENVLRESESRLATALWGARAAFWQWHRPTDTRTLSPLWFAMTGHTREQWYAVPDPWQSRLHPDDRHRVLKKLDYFRSASSVDSLEIEYRVLCAKGEYRWMLDRARVVEWDPTGPPALIMGVSLDIDTQKATEGRLREVEARLQTAMWGARMGLCETDCITGNTQWFNDWCEQLGIDPCSGDGHVASWLDNIHLDDVAEVRSRYAEHIDNKSDYYDAEYRTRAHGEWRWIFERGRVVDRHPDGRATRMIRVCMDIESRKLSQGGLKAIQENFETALHIARAGVWEVEVKDWSANYSDGYYQLLGVPLEQGRATPKFWQTRVHPDDLYNVTHTFLDYAAGRSETFEQEYRLRHEDGRWLWVLGRGRAVSRDEDGKPLRVVGFIMDITSRRDANDALRQSEERFRVVANLTPGYIFESRVQPDGSPKIVFASDSFEQLMGCSHDEFIARGGWRWFCDAPSFEQLQTAHEGVLQARRADVDVNGTNARGERVWLHIRSLPVFDPVTGKRGGSIGAVHDITEAKHAETALRESQLVLQTITAGSATQLALFDLEQRCVFANRSLHGLPAEQMIGKRMDEILPAQHATAVREAFDKVLTSGEGVDTLEAVQFDNGPLRWFEVRMRPVRTADRIVGLVTNINDVTEHRQQQQNLHLQGRIIETIREGVMLMDRDSNILLSNPALDQMFGYERGTLAGRHSSDLSCVSPAAFQRLHERVLKGIDDGEAPTMEHDAVRRDGTHLTAACIFAGIEIGGEPRIVVVVNDITERKLLERQVLQVATREQQRIGGDLHDGLGQQLTGIALMLKSLLPRLTRAGGDVQGEMEEIIALVNDAIDSTRSLARGLSPVRAGRDGLLMGLEELVSKTFERYKVRVSLDYSLPQTPDFDDDTATHLYRIAQEALGNAVRHGKASRVAITLALESGQVNLIVCDNGGGFDRRVTAGAGMGLKIMRFRAQMIGGDLVVESEPGAGSTIRCHCPLRSDA